MSLSKTQALELLKHLSEYVADDSIIVQRVTTRAETVDVRSVGDWASKEATGRHTIEIEVFQKREDDER